VLLSKLLINTRRLLTVPKLPRHCPACNTSLLVTRLACPKCGTEVTGSFQPDLFSRLAPNDFDFVVLFVKSRGNVKEMERELGISYWTIRSRLNEIVDQLGLETAALSTTATSSTETATARRQQILEQLNAGLLTVNEAAGQLEELKNKS
jgi:hypothetical protein